MQKNRARGYLSWKGPSPGPGGGKASMPSSAVERPGGWLKASCTGLWLQAVTGGRLLALCFPREGGRSSPCARAGPGSLELAFGLFVEKTGEFRLNSARKPNPAEGWVRASSSSGRGEGQASQPRATVAGQSERGRAHRSTNHFQGAAWSRTRAAVLSPAEVP